jgi:hypothetical protein
LQPWRLLGQRLCRIATFINSNGPRGLIAIDRRISIRRGGEDLRLDIERKRAMFPKHKYHARDCCVLSLTLARDAKACHAVDIQPSSWSRTFKKP